MSFREPSPLDFECPTCGAPPGERCTVRDTNGAFFSVNRVHYTNAGKPTEPHAPRYYEATREQQRLEACERERHAAYRRAHPDEFPPPPSPTSHPLQIAWDVAKVAFAVGIFVLSIMDKRNQK